MAAATAVGRSFGGAGRLTGVDLARGLAVIGMLAAHLLDIPPWEWSDPSTWTDLASGRSSILFATLAGVSIALVSGGPAPLPRGRALTMVRRSLAVRAGLLWLIGIALIATGVPVLVILPAYALLFLLALPLLRLRARTLWILAGILALIMPWLQPALDALPIWQGEVGGALLLLVGWTYPFPLWMTFLVAGLAAGRSDLGALRTQVRLVVTGAVLALAGYAAGAVAVAAAPTFGLDEPAGGSAAMLADPAVYLSFVLTAEAHSGGLFEVIGSGGFALAALAAWLLACRLGVFAAAVLPLRAVGSMPLTAYVGQLVVWALVAALVLGDTSDLVGMRDLHLFWPFVLGTIAFCTIWALTLRRGPLEGLLAAAVRLAVRG